MSKIIEELLVLARVKQGRQKLKFSRSRLDTLINQEINKLKPLQEGRNIKVKKIPAVILNMDREKIGYVIRNLIENAIKFTDPQQGIIKIEIRKNKNQVIFKIADNGIGIGICMPKIIIRSR